MFGGGGVGGCAAKRFDDCLRFWLVRLWSSCYLMKEKKLYYIADVLH